jgi:hypothetical protein
VPPWCPSPSPQYPFGGLPNFPEAYPILLSGNAQSNTSVGEQVTVLAQSGEVFSSLPSALPTFDQWLNYSAGVNINKTIESLSMLKLPPPVNETEGAVTCTTKYGRSYYLTVQFTFLAFLVGMQVGRGWGSGFGDGGLRAGWGAPARGHARLLCCPAVPTSASATCFPPVLGPHPSHPAPHRCLALFSSSCATTTAASPGACATARASSASRVPPATLWS